MKYHSEQKQRRVRGFSLGPQPKASDEEGKVLANGEIRSPDQAKRKTFDRKRKSFNKF